MPHALQGGCHAAAAGDVTGSFGCASRKIAPVFAGQAMHEKPDLKGVG
ncbi:MAG: hypothetical protein ACXIU7_14395 [Roseinatronobacter sp.]